MRSKNQVWRIGAFCGARGCFWALLDRVFGAFEGVRAGEVVLLGVFGWLGILTRYVYNKSRS
jgi:hypothetical protein